MERYPRANPTGYMGEPTNQRHHAHPFVELWIQFRTTPKGYQVLQCACFLQLLQYKHFGADGQGRSHNRSVCPTHHPCNGRPTSPPHRLSRCPRIRNHFR
eukprot:PhF_6_TR18922/c0_g1_i1/m.27674